MSEPFRSDWLRWVTAALREHKARVPMPGDKRPAAGNNDNVLALANKMLQVHGAFAQRGVAGVRDADGRSVPLSLALKAMHMLKERRP
jgi:hypothetical protein